MTVRVVQLLVLSVCRCGGVLPGSAVACSHGLCFFAEVALPACCVRLAVVAVACGTVLLWHFLTQFLPGSLCQIPALNILSLLEMFRPCFKTFVPA
jgi:hypothetical protein